MIIKAKVGDIIELPEKLQFMGVDFDLILVEGNAIGFADSHYFKMNNIVMAEYKIDKNNLYDFKKEDEPKIIKEIMNNKSFNRMSEIIREAIDNNIDHK